MDAIIEIVQRLDSELIPSTAFSILHALNNAYNVKKTSQPGSTVFKKVVGTIVLACGGGILTNALLGNPQSILFSSLVVPVYGGLAILFSLFPTWFLTGMEALPASLRMNYFHLIDALSRGYTLPRFISYLRTVETPAGLSCSLIGQFILAVVSITGGGLLYSWFFQNRPWTVGGWAFNWICVIALLNLFYFEIIDSHPDNLFLYQLRISLEENNLLAGIPELKLVTSLLIFAALVSKPKIVPAAKEFAVPPPVYKVDVADDGKDESDKEKTVSETPTSVKKGAAKKSAAGSRSSSPRRSRRVTNKKKD